VREVRVFVAKDGRQDKTYYLNEHRGHLYLPSFLLQMPQRRACASSSAFLFLLAELSESSPSPSPSLFSVCPCRSTVLELDSVCVAGAGAGAAASSLPLTGNVPDISEDVFSLISSFCTRVTASATSTDADSISFWRSQFYSRFRSHFLAWRKKSWDGGG